MLNLLIFSLLLLSSEVLNNLRLRAFWAVDDWESCERYAQEHSNVLRHYGVTNVTSASPEWMSDPDVLVLLIESMDGKQAFAGARVHLHRQGKLLPFQVAIGKIDSSVSNYVKEQSFFGTGEICGLWNAKVASGLGLATKHIMRAGIALTERLEIGRLLAFCAEHTLDICTEKGFEVITSLGENGCFYYPKEDYVARAMVLFDPLELSKAKKVEKEIIEKIRDGKEYCPDIETYDGSQLNLKHIIEIRDYV